MIKKCILNLSLISLIVISISALFPISVYSESTILYVGGNEVGNYETIQEAIDNANEGDIIELSQDSYKENIVIDKSLTIRGKNKETTIIYGNGTGNIIEITKDNVKVENLTIKNNTLDSSKVNYSLTGILIKSNSSKIVDCIIMNCNIGIIIKNSTDHMIQNSIISNNNGGIDLFNITNSKLRYCKITNNKNLWGISIRKNNGTNINTCNISNNNVGIGLSQSSDNTINHNVIMGNTGIGLSIVYDIENICCKNNGIYENNFIDNQVLNAKDNCGGNLWDNEILGNYWDDYTGIDEDFDGIGDSPMMIFGGFDSYDNYPLMNPMDINLDLEHSSESLITISYPLANTTQKGIIDIIGTISDSKIESVEIKLDNDDWDQALGISSWSYELDTSKYEDGNHTIYVKATDSEGNSSIRNIDINIKNSDSDPKNEEGTPGFEIIFIFFSITVIVLYFHKK